MIIISLLLFIVGAAIGSFVNVVALRYNTGLSFVRGDSRCLVCNKKIESKNLIPIFSYINLWGRCAHCKSKLPISYFLVEVISGFFLLLLYLKIGLSSEFFFLAACYYLLATIFIYDLRHKIIPDSFVFLFIILSFAFSFFYSDLSTVYLLLSTILVPLPFFLIWLFSKGRLLGFGDIKLMAGMGALLGLKMGIEAVFISFWIGAAFVLIKFLLTRKSSLTMKSEIPFAPFLVLGTVMQFFFQFKLF
jgi:leader peptidase (prepilin peptidase) / N-methyltransferase